MSNLPLMRACRQAQARALARAGFAFARKAAFERNLRCSGIDSLPAREAAVERFALSPCRRFAGAAGRPLSGAGAQIPADSLRGSHRPGADGAHARQFFRRRPHPSGLYPDRRARGRQDDDGPHSRPRVQLFPAGQDRSSQASTCPNSASTVRRSWSRATSTSSRWTPPPIPASTTCARSSRTRAIARFRRAPRSTSSTKCTCSRSRPSTAS